MRLTQCSVVGGYQNVYLLPMFLKKISYGSNGFPWTIGIEESSMSYAKEIPISEKMHDDFFLFLSMCLIAAFRKVESNTVSL